jgi:pyruvate kinase
VRVPKALICTLGPSSLNERVISRLEAAGVTSFRVNMSHTELGEVVKVIRLIQRSTQVPVCLDTEGAQIRTGAIREGTVVREGSRVRLGFEAARGDASSIQLTPGDAIGRMSSGTVVSVDFDSVVLRIEEVEGGQALASVLTGGEVGAHKAVTAYPSPHLPTFSEKDLAAIRLAIRLQVREYALSFCEDAAAVTQLRELVGSESTIIAKIESREAVRNLEAIARTADSLLIDRGDLSREVRLEAIPRLQKAIVRKANELGVPVYVATNLLESMVRRRTPTRAEVNDVINTLLDGADGLVLSSETAVGQYPVEAAQMVSALVKEFESSGSGDRIEELLGEHPLAALQASGAKPSARSDRESR